MATGPARLERPRGVLPTSVGTEPRLPGDSRVCRPGTRALLVADDSLYRCGLRALLENQPDLEVTGEASDCGAAAESLRHGDANVVLLDPRGLATDPLAAIRALNCHALLVLASPGAERVEEAAALRAGARGLLLTTASPPELAAAVRIVGAGYLLHLPSRTGRIGGPEEIRTASPREVPADFLNLTAREQQVFRLMVSGFANADIARMLSLGDSTIKSHVQHLLTKLDIPNRVHAVIYAYQHGLVPVCRQPVVAGRDSVGCTRVTPPRNGAEP